MEVKRTERGWPGHFIGANRCYFRRNTLLEAGPVKIVVSTVGLYESLDGRGFAKLGRNRYYETMAFHSIEHDLRYHDADVTREVDFNSPWAIEDMNADDQANDMHETVVAEITEDLSKWGESETEKD